MSVKPKTEAEIKIMRKAGKILAEILGELTEMVKPGITTQDLDDKAMALCKKYNVQPSFLGYEGFPAAICVGVDDVAVHGIPSTEEILLEGEIISIDMGVILEGYHSDSAVTVAVGEIDTDAQRLMETTRLALKAAIKQAVEGNRIGDIGFAIENVANMAGFSVIKQMTGHGIGKELHEAPEVPCFGEKGKGEQLIAGMTIAIEPMINEFDSWIEFDADGWTTRTEDGGRSAIFEHTIVVGKKAAEVLTIK